MSFNFADVVVVDDDQIGVIVKCWGADNYEVYVRSYSAIKVYKTKDMERYIYNKYLLSHERDNYVLGAR